MGDQKFTREENKLLYKKFITSGQEELKLMIALEAILFQEDISAEARKVYQLYLKQRRRPALRLAAEVEKTEFLWKNTGGQNGLWGKVRWNLSRKYPGFASAFSVLKPRPGKYTEAGCDGTYLYYPEKWESQMDEKKLRSLCALYLHMVLHCLFGHILPGEDREKNSWDLACDIYVERVLQKDFSRVLAPSLSVQVRQKALGQNQEGKKQQKSEILRELQKKIQPFYLEMIYQYLRKNPQAEEWKTLFTRDSHEFWRSNTYEECQGTDNGRDLEKAAERSRRRLSLGIQWNQIRRQTQAGTGEPGGKSGSIGGDQSCEISLKRQKKYDYRKFLERFAFPGEEMILDLDSFDYIPYMYSRQHYENLVFLEPLEYAEVHKLRELIIAIDTSGSCRGKIVRQFLEETYEILSRRENFFRKMRVHLIQCDSMIQGYACIQSQEQWKDYVEHLKVQGFGGTDFRPVFTLVEKMREKKEIQNPGGMIYFTDGDGIYPETAPDYETAFVFLNDALKKGTAPSWAASLILQIEVDEEE